MHIYICFFQSIFYPVSLPKRIFGFQKRPSSELVQKCTRLTYNQEGSWYERVHDFITVVQGDNSLYSKVIEVKN